MPRKPKEAKPARVTKRTKRTPRTPKGKFHIVLETDGQVYDFFADAVDEGLLGLGLTTTSTFSFIDITYGDKTFTDRLTVEKARRLFTNDTFATIYAKKVNIVLDATK